MQQNMRSFLNYMHHYQVRVLVVLAVFLISYSSASFAQTTCSTSYTSVCPGAAIYPGSGGVTTPGAKGSIGCTADGYPAFNGAGGGGCDGAPCCGTYQWSTQGTNTYGDKAAAIAAPGAIPANVYESAQGDAPDGYTCFELAARYWKFRFAIDINAICTAQRNCQAENLQNLVWPGSVTVYKAGTPYTPVCGDIVSYSEAAGNAYDHVDVVTAVDATGAHVTTLNQNTGGSDPWSYSPVNSPDGGGTSGYAYIHFNANTSTGSTCSQGQVASNSLTAREEPFALAAFNTGIATITDSLGDVNIFTHNGKISQSNEWPGSGFKSWADLNDDAGYDPVVTMDKNQALNLFYIGTDGFIYHDYQDVSGGGLVYHTVGSNPNTPDFTNGINLRTGYSKDPTTHHWVPVQLTMPPNVIPSSNINVATDSNGLVHVIFLGAFTDATGAVTTKIYETIQATPNNEYASQDMTTAAMPTYDVYSPIIPIATGGTQQLYCSTGSCPAVLGAVPTILPNSMPDGYPTILNDTATGTMHMFFHSDDTDLANNNKGSIWHMYWSGGHWSAPVQIRVTSVVGNPPIIPVANSNIAAVSNPDGRMELFYVGADQSLYHMWQKVPGFSDGDWSVPLSLGDTVTSDPVAIYNNKVGGNLAVMQVFYRDSGGDIKTYYRTYNSEISSVPPYAGVWGCRFDIVNSTSSRQIGNLPNTNHKAATNVYDSYPQVSIPASAPFVNSRVAVGLDNGGQFHVFFVGVHSPSRNEFCNDLSMIDLGTCTGSKEVSANSIWHTWQYASGVNEDCVQGPKAFNSAAAIALAGAPPAIIGQSGNMTVSPTGWIGGSADLDYQIGGTCGFPFGSCTDICPQPSCGLWYNLPFPQSIGGQEVEAATIYGSSYNPPGGPTCATDAFIERWEGYVADCYGDANGETWGAGGTGNETFGIGTCIDSSCSSPPAAGWICPPPVCPGCDAWTFAMPPSPAPVDITTNPNYVCNVNSKLGADAAHLCADDYLQSYLTNEFDALFGPPATPGGMVHADKVSQLTSCQMNALASFAYQDGLHGVCVGQVIIDINNGNFTQARNDFINCGGADTRREGEQQEWDAVPPLCTADATVPPVFPECSSPGQTHCLPLTCKTSLSTPGSGVASPGSGSGAGSGGVGSGSGSGGVGGGGWGGGGGSIGGSR